MSNFINPYNFIPLRGVKAKAKDDPAISGEKYTGFIEYTIQTKTPLFIPNTSNTDAFCINVDGHKSYDFFSYQDLTGIPLSDGKTCYEPVIPGSEMRGLIRSNYEILTNSCLFNVDDEVISKRTDQVFMAGLIKKDGEGFHLYEARDCIYREGEERRWADAYRTNRFLEGEKVYVDVMVRDGRMKPLAKNPGKEKLDGKTVGYVIKGEDSPGGKNKKHCLHVFCVKGSEPIKKNISITVLDQVLKEYHFNNPKSYKEYAAQWMKFKEGNENTEAYFPVYYSYTENKCTDGTYIMLSPASKTREVYKNKIGQMIKGHEKCNHKNELCPACALFGTIEDKFKMKSRVRFSDLHRISEGSLEDVYYNPITLEPLATPKINNMEFYYKRPSEDAWFWTGDYWIDYNGKIHSYIPQINGRKFYWHHPSMELKEGEEPSKLNITIRPLKQGVLFRGKIFFDNITKTELDTLIYVVNAGDRNSLEEKEHGYKLGAAKPLGYGSIKLNADRIVLRTIEKDDEHKVIELQEKEYLDYNVEDVAVMEPLRDSIKEDFAIMTGFDSVGEETNIAYPKTSYSPDIFEWFRLNHAGYKKESGSGRKVRISMPNERKQMAYVEYMEALSAQLKSTGFSQNVESNDQSSRKPSYNNGKDKKEYSNSSRNVPAGKGILKGKVKKFVEEKNFGFILAEDGEDYYVYVKNIDFPEKFRPNASVEFEVRVNRKSGKTEAYNVRVK